jgi:hypothetical protein
MSNKIDYGNPGLYIGRRENLLHGECESISEPKATKTDLFDWAIIFLAIAVGLVPIGGTMIGLLWH